MIRTIGKVASLALVAGTLFGWSAATSLSLVFHFYATL